MAVLEQKKPQRSCIACHGQGDKDSLLRFVRDSQGAVMLDPSGKAKGRGAYICANEQCFQQMKKKRRLNAALRVSLRDEDYERLQKDFNVLVNTTDEG